MTTRRLQVLVITVIVFAVFYMIGLLRHRPTPSEENLPTTGQGLDLQGPTLLQRDFVALPETDTIKTSLVIAKGTVTNISTSCWNAPNCTYIAPSETWDPMDDENLLDEFQPVRYFTVTISVDEFWHNELNLSSPISVTEFGRSPNDSPSLPYVPGELVYDPATRANWAVGADVVVMLTQAPLDYGNSQIDILLAPMTRQYFIQPGGGLTNAVSAFVGRSTTLATLHSVVQSIYP